ncbi:VOC family protein [Gammaproteobacteria bacterium]|nr:VOC family protein [Gammaproteobacteria bacterium]
MFSHVMLGATDIEKSKIFYDATLGVLGSRPGKLTPGHDGKKRYIYFIDNKNSFLITEPINGQNASHGNGTTIGFHASSTEMIDAWYEAGKNAGGTYAELCEPPGMREGMGMKYYLAYLLDPSGNKICTMYNVPRDKS